MPLVSVESCFAETITKNGSSIHYEQKCGFEKVREDLAADREGVSFL